MSGEVSAKELREFLEAQSEPENSTLQSMTSDIGYQEAKERDRLRERELLGLRKPRAQHGRDIQLAKAKKKRRAKK